MIGQHWLGPHNDRSQSHSTITRSKILVKKKRQKQSILVVFLTKTLFKQLEMLFGGTQISTHPHLKNNHQISTA